MGICTLHLHGSKSYHPSWPALLRMTQCLAFDLRSTHTGTSDSWLASMWNANITTNICPSFIHTHNSQTQNRNHSLFIPSALCSVSSCVAFLNATADRINFHTVRYRPDIKGHLHKQTFSAASFELYTAILGFTASAVVSIMTAACRLNMSQTY